MCDLARFEELVPLDHGLAVVVTRRADRTPHATVVNAGVLPHPVTGETVVALVAAGGTRKLVHLRADPTITVVVRAGRQWTTVEGDAQLIGPDDAHADIGDERLRQLLREIFTAAGGTHDDWDAYDRTMREERRTAVMVTPTRVYSPAARRACRRPCSEPDLNTPEDGANGGRRGDRVRVGVMWLLVRCLGVSCRRRR
jgi:PPOX class probable F420-dependent enzyme